MTAPVALLYDIHGNLPALRAVLADARSAGAGSHVLGGDYTAFGAWPVETLAALDALAPASTTWIRGNWDRWLATCPAGDQPDTEVVRGAAAHALAALDPAAVRRLGDLDAQTAVVTPDGVASRIVHGSARSDMTSFLPTHTDHDAANAAGVSEPRLIFGHTHLQFLRPGPGGIELLNPGSVGLPLDGDVRAAYALVHSDGVELRRVDYDHAGSAAALRAIDAPWASEIAGRLERGHA
ncbi:metallophosphoesterase [Paraconexibacter sp.]|uniref:metallophosphoesterase family protein n=1 Tax=Paraconexibacter sp. TaxID=2949640 RepID=UPI003565F931